MRDYPRDSDLSDSDASGDPSDDRFEAEASAYGDAGEATGDDLSLTEMRQAYAEEFARREEHLNRRERSLNEQLAALDREMRAFRLTREEAELLHAEVAVEIQAKRSDLEHRLTRAEQLIADLEAEQDRFAAERETLGMHREAMREQVLAEFHSEREAIDYEREALHTEKQRFRKRLEEQTHELNLSKEELRRSWETEREALRRQLTGKLAAEAEAERKRFLEEQTAWNTQRDEELAALEAERAAQEQAIQKTREELSRLRQELDGEFERRRANLKQEIDAQVAAAETSFCDEQAKWEQFRDSQRAELDAVQTELARFEAALAERQDALLREQAAAQEQLQQERAQLQQERTAVQVQLQREQATASEQLERERAAFEQQIEDARATIITEEQRLTELRSVFESERENFAAEQQTQAAALAEQLTAERTAHQARLDELNQRAREERDAAEQAHEEQLAAATARQMLHLSDLRAEHAAQIQEERDAWQKEQETARLALDAEREASENRLHFQQEHLQRTRNELEAARLELERRLQEGRTQAVSMGEMHRLRHQQLNRFRILLDQREKAIDRERESLREALQLLDERRRHQETRRSNDDESFQREQAAEHLAIRQMREELQSRAEQLAARQSRLDTLRVELETTHRENLELRVSLDEAWVRLTQVAGPDKAKKCLQSVRHDVADHFRRLDSDLDRRRAMLAEEMLSHRKLIEEVEQKRREQSSWLSDQLASLSRREEELRRWSSAIETQERRSRQTQARWQTEKSEASQVIRGLLQQLSEAPALLEHSPTPTADPADPQARRAG